MNANDLNPYGQRIAAAALTLNLSHGDLVSKLAAMGVPGADAGIKVLDSEDFKFGDFRETFKDQGIVALRIAFRELKGGKSEPKEAVHTSPGSTDPRTELLRSLGMKIKLEDADPAVLLPHYLPDKPNDPISTALRKRFGDRAVVAFHDDGKVAVTESLEYIGSLEQHYPEQQAITVDGKLTKLYAIGVKPNQMVDEDPLFPGQPLRNGHSVVNNRRWTEISLECRQLCRIVVERGDVDPNNREAVLRLMERAKDYVGLAEAYPEADLEFRERKGRDELPKLKVQLGGTSNKPQNPFGVPRRY